MDEKNQNLVAPFISCNEKSNLLCCVLQCLLRMDKLKEQISKLIEMKYIKLEEQQLLLAFNDLFIQAEDCIKNNESLDTIDITPFYRFFYANPDDEIDLFELFTNITLCLFDYKIHLMSYQFNQEEMFYLDPKDGIFNKIQDFFNIKGYYYFLYTNFLLIKIPESFHNIASHFKISYNEFNIYAIFYSKPDDSDEISMCLKDSKGWLLFNRNSILEVDEGFIKSFNWKILAAIYQVAGYLPSDNQILTIRFDIKKKSSLLSSEYNPNSITTPISTSKDTNTDAIDLLKRIELLTKQNNSRVSDLQKYSTSFTANKPDTSLLNDLEKNIPQANDNYKLEKEATTNKSNSQENYETQNSLPQSNKDIISEKHKSIDQANSNENHETQNIPTQSINDIVSEKYQINDQANSDEKSETQTRIDTTKNDLKNKTQENISQLDIYSSLEKQIKTDNKIEPKKDIEKRTEFNQNKLQNSDIPQEKFATPSSKNPTPKSQFTNYYDKPKFDYNKNENSKDNQLYMQSKKEDKQPKEPQYSQSKEKSSRKITDFGNSTYDNQNKNKTDHSILDTNHNKKIKDQIQMDDISKPDINTENRQNQSTTIKPLINKGSSKYDLPSNKTQETITVEKAYEIKSKQKYFYFYTYKNNEFKLRNQKKFTKNEEVKQIYNEMQDKIFQPKYNDYIDVLFYQGEIHHNISNTAYLNNVYYFWSKISEYPRLEQKLKTEFPFTDMENSKNIKPDGYKQQNDLTPATKKKKEIKLMQPANKQKSKDDYLIIIIDKENRLYYSYYTYIVNIQKLIEGCKNILNDKDSSQYIISTKSDSQSCCMENITIQSKYKKYAKCLLTPNENLLYCDDHDIIPFAFSYYSFSPFLLVDQLEKIFHIKKKEMEFYQLKDKYYYSIYNVKDYYEINPKKLIIIKIPKDYDITQYAEYVEFK